MEYASLGKVVFKIPHYKAHSERGKYEWVDINTIFAPSSQQFFGAENEEIKIQVVWHIDFCNPLDELNKLKQQAKEGQPYKLIIGSVPFGDFVIKEINSETQKIDAKGNPIIIKAVILLKGFTAKALQTRKTKQKTKPKAVRRTKTISEKEFVKTYSKGNK